MKQLDPKAVWLFFFSSLVRSIVPFMVIGIWSSAFISGFMSDFGYGVKEVGGVVSFGFLNLLWLIIPLYLVLVFIWAKLTYHFYRYELIENGFRKESGIIYKKYVTIPYDRIQNVDIHRGILARILGLSDLSIQTAGTSATISRYGMSGISAEGRLPATSMKVAEELRDELIQRARNSKNQGL